MIRRRAYLQAVRAALANNPVCAPLGPRQCGKTTLHRLVLGACVLFIWPFPAKASPPQRDAALVAAIDKLVAKHGITDDGPGVAIFARQPGKLHFMKGYGLARLKDRARTITSRTMFELASVSKSFTATAVLILHERGQLSIDDDVRRHIPELPAYGNVPAGNGPISGQERASGQEPVIRIKDLLQHVSGLPSYLDFEEVPAGDKGYWVNADYVGEFARQRAKFPLGFQPGEKYEYNNTNFMLLAVVVERVAKKPFGAFLHDEIFVPAGMKHTFVYEGPQAAPERPAPGCTPAVGYEKNRKNKRWKAGWGSPPFRHEELLTCGDGAIWSNLEDMAEWDAALRAGRLLKPATMELALTPSKTRDGQTNGYGFGWSVYFDEQGTLIGYGHDGSWGGFRTSYYRLLAADRTTVVLSNRGNFNTDKFWYALNEVIEKHWQ